MVDVLIGFLKFTLMVVTTVIGVLGILGRHRDKAERLTGRGRSAIGALIVAGTIGAVLQGVQTFRDLRMQEAGARLARETIAKQNELLGSVGLNLDRQNVVLNNTDSIQAQTRLMLSVQKTVLRQLSHATALSERTAIGQGALAAKSAELGVGLAKALDETRNVLHEQQEQALLSRRAFHPLSEPTFSFRWSLAIDSTVFGRLSVAANKLANRHLRSYALSGWTGVDVPPESAYVRSFYNFKTGVSLYTYGPATPQLRDYFGMAFGEPSDFDPRHPRRRPPLRPRISREEIEYGVEREAGIFFDNLDFTVSFWRDSTGVLAQLRNATRHDVADLTFHAPHAPVGQDRYDEDTRIDFVNRRVLMGSRWSIHGERGYDNRKMASTLDLPGALMVVTPTSGRLAGGGLSDLRLESVAMDIPGRDQVYLQNGFVRVERPNGQCVFVHVLTETEVTGGW